MQKLRKKTSMQEFPSAEKVFNSKTEKITLYFNSDADARGALRKKVFFEIS